MKKKILFIYPSSYDTNQKIIKSRKSFMPSRSLPYLAALTPKRYNVRIVDEIVENVNFNEDVDLIALGGMMRNTLRAIDIAKGFHSRGKQVVIGGVGAYSLRDKIEKSNFFSSHIVGEVDKSWEIILDDFEHNKLKPVYECKTPDTLENLPWARFDLLNRKKYLPLGGKGNPFMPIETSRGCPRNCKFCLVSNYFGRKMRYRPIGEIIEEIKNQPSRFIFFTDDNIGFDRKRAKELFLALKPLDIIWYGQFESNVIEDPELLRLAREGGCVGALVGIESLIECNLHSINKSQNIKFKIYHIAKAFKEANIPLIASMIFGFEGDSSKIINWTMDSLIKNDVDVVMPWMLTPFPGTQLFDECKKEGRLIHENYSLYDGWHPVIKIKTMPPKELEKAYWHSLRRFYNLGLVLKRLLTITRDDAGGVLILIFSYFKIRRNFHPLSGGL